MITLNQAREIAHTLTNRRDWQEAIAAGECDVTKAYLTEHSPYKTTASARAARSRRLNAQRRQDILTLERALEIHDRCSKSYFYRAPRNAPARRRYEAQNTTPPVKILVRGREFSDYELTLEQSCTCSTKNIYYKMIVDRDGKTKDVRAVRAALAALKAI